MLTMAEVIDAHTSLKASDVMWLEHLVAEWHLLADLAFSDLILWVPDVDDNVFWACAQVRPTTGPTALEDDVVGEDVHYDPEHQVTEAYLSHEIVKTSGNQLSAGIPVDVHTIPVVRDGRVIGIVEAHTNRMGCARPVPSKTPISRRPTCSRAWCTGASTRPTPTSRCRGCRRGSVTA